MCNKHFVFTFLHFLFLHHIYICLFILLSLLTKMISVSVLFAKVIFDIGKVASSSTSKAMSMTTCIFSITMSSILNCTSITLCRFSSNSTTSSSTEKASSSTKTSSTATSEILTQCNLSLEGFFKWRQIILFHS
ncbi:hypothetical protein KFK09_014874 [Dendrobium nobile]|uniref:Uncharacterized protein n=1 Tax=Dendrobium nobile TaxID=94219 RepID=A0A8T3B4B4_DENNO|nr:hypothetical protein KFK09_014874 [Dendrobium nobile]